MSAAHATDPESRDAPLVAITGASGFIGRALVPELVRAGFGVRLLLRRDPLLPEWRHLRPGVVAGSLADPAALTALVEDAVAVIHLAGLIKAARRREFFTVNRDGAAALADAAIRRAPAAHFVLVSSLAAREPQLSDYAASKRAGELVVRETLGARATILRPPVVYGPGDRETLRFFRLARARRVPVAGRPGARAAMIHVQDLARLVAALVALPPAAAPLSAADARPEGYCWEEVMGAAAHAVGNASPRFLRLPGWLLKGVALAGDSARLCGSAAMLNSQKLRELRHPDWSVPRAELALPAGWSPGFDLASGFRDTVAWYRRAGWLPG